MTNDNLSEAVRPTQFEDWIQPLAGRIKPETERAAKSVFDVITCPVGTATTVDGLVERTPCERCDDKALTGALMALAEQRFAGDRAADDVSDLARDLYVATELAADPEWAKLPDRMSDKEIAEGFDNFWEHSYEAAQDVWYHENNKADAYRVRDEMTALCARQNGISFREQRAREDAEDRAAHAGLTVVNGLARTITADPVTGAAISVAQQASKSEDWSSRFKSGASLLDEPEIVPAIWGHGDEVLWAEGEPLMICGPSGVGKTTLAAQVVRARLGLDDKVLGLPVEQTGSKVLYLMMDRPRQAMRALKRIFTDADRGVLAERLVIWNGPPVADMAKDPTILTKMCQQAGADTVIVDSLKDAAIGLSEDAVGAAYNSARQAAIAAGIEVMELHHQRKAGANGGEPKTISDIYGSMHLVAGIGSAIILWGAAGDPVIQMRHVKQPVAEVGPWQLEIDHAAGVTTVKDAVDLVTLAGGLAAGVTAQSAAAAIFDKAKPSTAEIEKARRKLEALVRAGQLTKTPGASQAPATYHGPQFDLVTRHPFND